MLTESSGFTNGPDDNSSEKLDAAFVLLDGLFHCLRHGFLPHRSDKNGEGEILSLGMKKQSTTK